MEMKLPDLGEGVLEGEIVNWKVKPGDKLHDDQVVVEIMTDKATMEIPTHQEGVVKELLAKEGDIVKVGQVIMRLEGAAGGVQAKKSEPAPAKKEAPAPVKQAAAAPTPAFVENTNIAAAPAVRKLAREMGINLAQVRGSGPGGRVLLEDLQRGPSAGGFTMPNRGVRGERKEERVPVRGLRRKIVEKMAESKRTAAHFTYVEECDVTELVEFRQKLKPIAEKMGTKITFMPFLAKAAAIALKEFPDLNAQLVEENGHPKEIIYKKYYNLGMAVDTEEGLTVPVVKDVDHKGIWELSKEMQELALKARDKKLAPSDFHDGTFTITNAGNIGGLLATPIINYPEVAIMGVHQIKKRPVVMNGNKIRIRDIMYLSISLDHRVVDGAVAARFMNRVVELVQDPKMLLMELMGPMF